MQFSWAGIAQQSRGLVGRRNLEKGSIGAREAQMLMLSQSEPMGYPNCLLIKPAVFMLPLFSVKRGQGYGHLHGKMSHELST